MTRFSQTSIAQRWLARFPAADLGAATALLDEILLVRADDFNRAMIALVDQVMAERKGDRPLALYAERAVETDALDVLPVFLGMAKGRATGPGPLPVVVDPDDPEVGSEGMIANFITSYCRRHDEDAFNHPGPDLMRDKKVGPIVIVTDFVGSGERVFEMLEAFRKVATLRSWKSYGLIEYFVVAYSATEAGIARVQESDLKPRILTYTGCPTLHSAFRGAMRSAVYALCQAYPGGQYYPHGYRNSGALIAFEHGIPDNAPPILYEGWGGLDPLLKGRSTIDARDEFPETNRDELAERAAMMLQMTTAGRHLSSARGRRWIRSMLVLTAIEQGARTAATISARTRIRLAKVKDILDFTLAARWTDGDKCLTELGRAELQRLRRRRARIPVLPKKGKPYYYPGQLRAR